jgi:predicted RNA binding protein YcfA (HicA-like mRNA interferase family)
MGERLPPITARELARIVQKQGFRFKRPSGSHAGYEREDGRRVLIPMHGGDMGKGLLRKIIKDLGLSVEEFNDLR